MSLFLTLTDLVLFKVQSHFEIVLNANNSVVLLLVLVLRPTRPSSSRHALRMGMDGNGVGCATIHSGHGN